VLDLQGVQAEMMPGDVLLGPSIDVPMPDQIERALRGWLVLVVFVDCLWLSDEYGAEGFARAGFKTAERSEFCPSARIFR